MHRKKYVSPDFEQVRLTLKDIILSSPEDFSGHIDGPGDWGDDPELPDPGDDIDWG